MVGLAANVGGLARDVITPPITVGIVKNIGGLAKDAITSPVTADAARSMGGLARDTFTSMAGAALEASNSLRSSRDPSPALPPRGDNENVGSGGYFLGERPRPTVS